MAYGQHLKILNKLILTGEYALTYTTNDLQLNFHSMTKRSLQIRPQTQKAQLFQAINAYLQDLGFIENSFNPNKNPSVHQLELTVRSLNLQRLP